MGSVLIVDDDEVVRTLVADFLASEGYQCTQADNVAQACRHLAEKRFELTISDFNMPRETGLDLLRYVVSNFPYMQFIMISGSPGAQIRTEALALGAAAYMAKPFKLQELLREVESGFHRQIIATESEKNRYGPISRTFGFTPRAAYWMQQGSWQRTRSAGPGFY